MTTPDQTAQLDQLTEGVVSLLVTLASIRASPGCDPVKIRLAEKLLEQAARYAREAINR